MPAMIRRLTSQGLQPVSYTAGSLAEAAAHEPDDGVYTVANTVNTYDVLKLAAHLARLEDSARREGIPLEVTQTQLRAGLRDMITEAGYGDVRFRITIPRATPGEPILSIEPFGGYPASLYENGVRVKTIPNSARHNAAAKTSDWMHARHALQQDTNAYEIILLDAEQHLLEGATSNFYAIQAGALYTALDGVLGGISRQMVFEIAPDVLPLVRRPLTLGSVPTLQEAFISSSSRGIVPVVRIDDTTLSNGTPGPYTRQLMAAYRNWATSHLETI